MDPQATFTLPPAAADSTRSLYYFRGGTLKIEVTNNANNYGKLVVNGAATLAGTCNFANMSVTTLTSPAVTTQTSERVGASQ